MTIRVYEPQTLATGAEIPLGERNVQHLVRVLRLGAGDTLVVFNGDGGEYGAQVASTGKRDCVVRIGARREPASESALAAHLGQVMSKGDRMEYAVQKAAELGVGEITPLFSSRCEIRLDDDRLEKKREHLQMVAVAACEQSGRVRVPTVHAPLALEKWVAKVQAQLKLVLHPGETRPALPAACGSAALLVGPEGGLTAEEVAAAQRAGFAAFTLGPRILRTETAPVAALAVLQARYGDLGA